MEERLVETWKEATWPRPGSELNGIFAAGSRFRTVTKILGTPLLAAILNLKFATHYRHYLRTFCQITG